MFWHIFGTFQIFTKSGPFHPLFISKTLKKCQNISTIFKILFLYISKCRISFLLKVLEKTDTEQWWRSVCCFGKSWIWDQYLPETMNGVLVVWYQYLSENMKWDVGNMGLVSSNKILTVNVGTGKSIIMKIMFLVGRNNWCLWAF